MFQLPIIFKDLIFSYLIRLIFLQLNKSSSEIKSYCVRMTGKLPEIWLIEFNTNSIVIWE